MKLSKLAVTLAIILAGSLHAFSQSNPNEEQGLKPYDSWHGGDLDSVSMTNGGLSLHIPLVSFPQRGNLDLSFSVVFSNKQWHKHVAPRGGLVTWNPLPLTGTRIVSSADWWMNATYTDGADGTSWSRSVTSPDGNAHQFGMYLFSMYPLRSLDATGLLDPDTRTLITASGTRYTYPSALDDFTNTGGLNPTDPKYMGIQPSAVTDANGNQITINASGWTDTMGRFIPGSAAVAGQPTQPGVPTTDLTGCPSGVTSALIWNVPGLNSGTRTFKFCYSPVTIAPTFGGVTYGPVTWSLLTAIVLPDGTMWALAYDTYGDVTRLGFPTGGSISYTYAVGPNNASASSNTDKSMWVTSRTVDANDGSGGHTWTYNYSIAPGNSSYCHAGIAVVTSPAGDDTVHSISDPVTSTCSGYDVQVQHYQGPASANVLLQTENTVYSGLSGTPAGVGDVTIDAVPTQSSVTVANGPMKKVVHTYDPATPNSGNAMVMVGSLLQQDEYDFSNTLVRSTANHYLWQDNATYFNNNFVTLKVSTTLKDSSGNQMAQTTYGYDQTAVTSSGVTTGLVAPPAGGNVRGNVTTVSHWLNTTDSLISSTVTYLDTGMKASSTDPKGNATTYTYSSTFAGAYMTQTNMPDTLMPDTGATVVHHVISGNYDFNTGLLTSFTDENSQTYSYQFDPLMLRLTEGDHPDGGQTLFTYPSVTQVERRRLISGTTYDDYKVNFDGLGRPIQSQEATPSGTILADTTYDIVGRVSTASNPYYQGSNHSTDPTYGVTTTQYDALSRAIKTIKQDGSFSTVQYNAPAGDGAGASVVCTTTTDEAGLQRQVCADALGRMVKVLEPNPNATGTPSISNNPYVTLYQYNVRNDLVCVHQKATDTKADVACTGSTPPSVPAAWRQRYFTYDSFSRLLTALNPEAGQTSFQYDNNGNMTSKTSPAPNQTGSATVTTYVTYDSLNRPLDKTYSDTTPMASFRYDYSSYGGASMQNPVGRLVMAWAANQANGGSLMSYDPMGRTILTYQMDPGVACCAVVTASYDKLGDLTTLSYPSGSFSMTYQYDSAARLTAASDSNGVTYAQNPTILASGAMQEFTSPNFSNNKFHADYNSRLQPTEIWTGSTQGASALFDKQYSYTGPNATQTNKMNNGNVYTVTNVKDDTRTQSFTYDPLNRLLTAGDKTHWANSYVYDAWGNLTNKNQGSLPQGENLQKSADTNNRLSGVSYDAAGNMTNDGTGGTYVYDAENRIISATNGGVTTTYVYDAFGRRIKKSNSSATTNYWFGPSGETAAETDASGNWTNYIFFGGQRLARNIMQPSPNPPDIKYYITDHLHSTAMFADKSGTVLDDNDFYPWGGGVPGVGTTTSNNHYKFTGKERDIESQLDYFGARYYANATGRFMSPDWAAQPTTVPYAEFGDPQSLNLYSYVRNNPIVRVDADGHNVFSDPFGTLGGSMPIVGTEIGLIAFLPGEEKPQMGGKKSTSCGGSRCEVNIHPSMVTSTPSADGQTLTITTEQRTDWTKRNKKGKIMAWGSTYKRITVTVPLHGEASATRTFEARAYKYSSRFGDLAGDPANSVESVTSPIDVRTAYREIGSTMEGSPGDAPFRGYQTVKNCLVDHSLKIIEEYANGLHNQIEVLQKRQEAERWVEIGLGLGHLL